MKDKEIIIDGVDVSKCCWCDFEPDTDPYCRINDGEDLGCEDNSNCYFKQLARKTQECEELKAYAQRQENQRETYYKEFLKLSRECEKLKSQVDEDYNYYTTELKTLRDIVSNKEKRNAALFLTSDVLTEREILNSLDSVRRTLSNYMVEIGDLKNLYFNIQEIEGLRDRDAFSDLIRGILVVKGGDDEDII